MIFTLYVVYRDVDCDADHHCPECNDASVSMSKYLAHKLSLQRNKKDPVPASAVASDNTDVAAEPAVVKPAASPVPASVTTVSPIHADNSSQNVRDGIMCQVRSLFDSFAQSLEVRFSSMDNRFSQVLSWTSKDDVQDKDVSQDVLASSLPAPTVVAGCAEPMPDRARVWLVWKPPEEGWLLLCRLWAILPLSACHSQIF